MVNPSALDYLQILRTHIPNDDQRPETLRLELTGSGHLQLTAGRSERVRTGFWQEPNSPDWGDRRVDAVFLPATKTLAYFQAFVNAGALNKPLRGNTEQEPELAILIVIGNRKNLLLTADPVFRELFRELLREF
ncbi:MAG: hypothetical protein ACNA71_03335 [Kiritimatiellia bacterium]